MSRDLAVVFIPGDVTDPAEFAQLAAPCLERVEACGYDLVGVVRTWDDAQAMMLDGRAHVLVVASTAYLPRDRRPRIESVTDPVRVDEAGPAVGFNTSQRRRRPRIVRGAR